MVPLKSIIFSKGWSHVPFRDHVSNENKPGCLGYIGFIGDEMLPSYAGIMSEIMKWGSLSNNQYFMESKRFFFGSCEEGSVDGESPGIYQTYSEFWVVSTTNHDYSQ